MLFDDNDDSEQEDREALRMYQISFTGPQAIEATNWKQQDAHSGKFVSDEPLLQVPDSEFKQAHSNS